MPGEMIWISAHYGNNVHLSIKFCDISINIIFVKFTEECKNVSKTSDMFPVFRSNQCILVVVSDLRRVTTCIFLLEHGTTPKTSLFTWDYIDYIVTKVSKCSRQFLY